jgi:7-keto-8-aminopelargonate synthetase-like enzyme
MTKVLTAAAIAFALTASLPAAAQDTASCTASWSKMDAKKQGYVMSTDSKEQMAMMTKAGRTTAAADRMTDKEYMDACIAKVFEGGKK